MDGLVYLAVYRDNRVFVFAELHRRDVTHVNVFAGGVILSSQQPRYQVDLGVTPAGFALQPGRTLEMDALR